MLAETTVTGSNPETITFLNSKLWQRQQRQSTTLYVFFLLLSSYMFWYSQSLQESYINFLMPNVNYSGRTAPLTSKVAFYIFIQQI